MSKNVGGFSFREARKRPAAAANEAGVDDEGASAPPAKRLSTGRRRSGLDEAPAAALEGAGGGGAAEPSAGALLRVEILSSLRASSGSATPDRLASVFQASFEAAKGVAGKQSSGGLVPHVESVRDSFMSHLASESAKEFLKPSTPTANPKNVTNARIKADTMRRIQQYEQELEHWAKLAAKASGAAAGGRGAGAGAAKGAAAAAVASPTAVRQWASTRGRHGKRVLAAVADAASKAMQDMDAVSTAMRTSSQTAVAAKRVVEAASRAARSAVLAEAGMGAKKGEAAGGGGGDGAPTAKAILRSMLRG